MIKYFNPKEILEISVKVEEQGQKLYAALELKVKDQKLKEACRYMKQQEEIHAKVFRMMLDDTEAYIVHEFNPGEYETYLKAIASEYIFTPEVLEKKTKEGFSSDLEAIEFGINIEKESIAVYSALRDFILANKQDVLDKIILEEKRHYADLIALKGALENSN